jgi:vacuolar-type H+-ATPase subunit E/Vma4
VTLGAARGQRRHDHAFAWRLAAVVALAVALGLGTAAGEAAATAGRGDEPKPAGGGVGRLWSTFPLDRESETRRQQPHLGDAAVRARRAPLAADESGLDPVLLAALAAAALTTVAIAAFVLRAQAVPRLARGRAGRDRSLDRMFRLTKGGSTMANRGRKRWARQEPAQTHGPTREQIAADGGNLRARERLAEYSATKPDSDLGDSAPGATTEAPVEQAPADSAGEEIPTDLVDVGEEVGAVLKTAREAATRIRRAATEEAAKLREEARTAVAGEVAETRRAADTEHSEARRVRAEADAYADDVRSGAEALAEHLRTEAEREAAQVLDGARSRLAAADAEVEKRVRQGETRARQRVDALEADAKRYEERLESLFVVFRGMSSQLEELLAVRRTDDEREGEREALDDALRPESASTEASAAAS